MDFNGKKERDKSPPLFYSCQQKRNNVWVYEKRKFRGRPSTLENK